MRVAKRPAIVIAAGLFVATSGTGALSNEGNCRQLKTWRGNTPWRPAHQPALKRRLVAWYNDNCKRTRNAQARR